MKIRAAGSPPNPEPLKPIIERVMVALEEDPSDAAKFAVCDPSILPGITE